MSAPFNTIFQKSASFERKEGAFIRGRRSLNISRQTGGADSREALFRVNMVSLFLLTGGVEIVNVQGRDMHWYLTT